MHPLCTTHKQQLRSLLLIPIPVPPPPRMHSGTLFDGETQKSNDAAAAYYMVLFSPWNQSKLPATTHVAWAEYCRKLQREESVVSLHRLAVMTNMCHGLGISPENDKACTSYRHRNVHKWNAPASHPDGTARPPGPAQGDNEEHFESESNFAAATDDAIAQLLQLSQGVVQMSAHQMANKIKKMGKENIRFEALMTQVRQAFPDIVHHDATTSRLSSLQLPPGNVGLFPFLVRKAVDAKLGINWLEAAPCEPSTSAEVLTEVRTNSIDQSTVSWPSNETLSSTQSAMVENLQPLLLLGSKESTYHHTGLHQQRGCAAVGVPYLVGHTGIGLGG